MHVAGPPLFGGKLDRGDVCQPSIVFDADPPLARDHLVGPLDLTKAERRLEGYQTLYPSMTVLLDQFPRTPTSWLDVRAAGTCWTRPQRT
jgi:hypothetical protein